MFASMLGGVTAELTWDPPGAGAWFLAREHVPLPVSRLYYELLCVAGTGWDSSAAVYGLPDGPTRWGFVHGWMYYGGRSADAAVIASREEAAAETLSKQRWREDVRAWHDELRPAVVAANRALQAEDPSSLDDAALDDHLSRVLQHCLDVFPIHFAQANAYSVGAGAVIERLLARGMTRAEIESRLSGGSPASARARVMIDAIVAEVGDRDVTSIADLRGAALDAYLDEYGLRVMGREELRGPVLLERPGTVVASVRARQRGHGGVEQPADTGDADVDELRSLYGLNDDNGGVVGAWPLGLVRRAGLEVASRVGCLEPNDVFETTVAELRRLRRDEKASVDELRGRAERRQAAERADPPPMLTGPDDDAGAPVDLPPSVARVDALRSVLWSGGAVPATVRASDERLRGVGIGDGVYRGRACVIDGEGIHDIEPGDVIIAFVTWSAHNTVFPIAGAVATEVGGALSHPAVLARELGLPAVVGVTGLLAAVQTGDLVEVDAAAGVVRLHF